MNFLRGRFWYSSIRLSISACRRMAASERSARSRPLTAGAGVSAGSGRGAALCTFWLDSRAWASRRCCRASSSCTRRWASARSRPGLRGSTTGSGVRARRFSSTLPPRSRFACARTSALAGRSFIITLTNTTSSGALADLTLSASGNRKWIESRTACRTMETASAPAKIRCPGSQPAAIVPRPRPAIIKCILTSSLQPFHILGILDLTGGSLHDLAGFRRPAVHAREAALEKIDGSYFEPNAGARFERGQRGHPDDERQAVESHEGLAQHDRVDVPEDRQST